MNCNAEILGVKNRSYQGKNGMVAVTEIEALDRDPKRMSGTLEVSLEDANGVQVGQTGRLSVTGFRIFGQRLVWQGSWEVSKK